MIKYSNQKKNSDSEQNGTKILSKFINSGTFKSQNNKMSGQLIINNNFFEEILWKNLRKETKQFFTHAQMIQFNSLKWKKRCHNHQNHKLQIFENDFFFLFLLSVFHLFVYVSYCFLFFLVSQLESSFHLFVCFFLLLFIFTNSFHSWIHLFNLLMKMIMTWKS